MALFELGESVYAAACFSIALYRLTMALPSAGIKLAGMILFGKHPVRTAALVITPLVMVGATQVDAALAGLRSAPSSSVPIMPSGPRSRREKSPLRSARVGSVRSDELVKRRIYFHSMPAKKKNLSLMIGPPKLRPKLL